MAMTNEEEIRAEVEELGRLTEAQEDILYNIALKQDELGREATNMLLEKVVDSEIYQPMIDREMLTYEVFNKGGKHEIACLYVTLKGMRYCITFGDEISSRRPVDPAGARHPRVGPFCLFWGMQRDWTGVILGLPLATHCVR